MKVLVIGDFHIPDRALEIPSEVMSLISGRKYGLVICTGDLTREYLLTELRRWGTLRWVMGNMDYIEGPLEDKIEIGRMKIGITHGTEIFPRGDREKLYRRALKMGVDILISGHTHRLDMALVRGVLLLNPGSATGVWGGGGGSGRPSFMELEFVARDVVAVKGYELELRGKMSVREARFAREAEGIVEIKR